MRPLLLLVCLLPSIARAASTRHPETMLRPNSYVVMLIRASQPGQVNDPSLRLYPPYPLFAGRSRLAVTVWWQQGQWRERDRWLQAPPAHTSSLARLTTAPVPSISASDGHRIWVEDPHARTVTVYPPDPAGTWPATDGSLKQFTAWSTLSGLLHSGVHCVTPTRHADGRIAGRPAYVLEFVQDQCRRLEGGHYANQSRLLDGRLVVWIDRQTHFTLRAAQYALGEPHRLMLHWRITSIRYNVPLNASLFRLTVPAGYSLVHGG
jgi:hypothetical protein